MERIVVTASAPNPASRPGAPRPPLPWTRRPGRRSRPQAAARGRGRV